MQACANQGNGNPLDLERRAQHAPWPLRMRRILLPVTVPTWAMPWLSRSSTPICEGVRPFLLALQMSSFTCARGAPSFAARSTCRLQRRAAAGPEFRRTSVEVTFSQLGGDRLYGSALEEIPLPGVCMRPAREATSQAKHSGPAVTPSRRSVPTRSAGQRRKRVGGVRTHGC